jgi:hypothetical protein
MRTIEVIFETAKSIQKTACKGDTWKLLVFWNGLYFYSLASSPVEQLKYIMVIQIMSLEACLTPSRSAHTFNAVKL